MTSKDDFASFMENAFSSESDRALRRLKKGDAVAGTVVQISNDCVFVDIGSRADGRIARAELENDEGELGQGEYSEKVVSPQEITPNFNLEEDEIVEITTGFEYSAARTLNNEIYT